MNRNRTKCKESTVNHDSCNQYSTGMGYTKANVLGTVAGILSGTITWILTLPFLGLARYQIIGSILQEKAYGIALWLVNISQQLDFIDTLSYEHALTITKISYFLLLIFYFTAMVIIIVLHEFTHKWVWQYGFDKSIKRSQFKMGIRKFMPYCHCNTDLPLKRMIAGTIAPTITTGLLIVAIGVAMHNPLIALLGIFGVVGGGSDQLQVLMLLPFVREAGRKRVICGNLDDEAGCMLYIEN